MRHAHILGRKNTALVIVDLQEKFIPVIQNADEIVQNTLRCTLTFQMFSMPVLVTEQYPQGLGSTVAVIRNQFPVLDVQEKVEFSCLQNGDFRKKISEVKPQNVVLCGVESHVCIEQTALDLLAAGYAVYVVVDAVGARRSIDHATAIEKMKLLGIIPVTTEMVLFELAEKAGTQSFKNIQRMVKFKLKKSILEKGTEGAGEPEATPLEEDDATTAEKDAAEKDAAEDGDVLEVLPADEEKDQSASEGDEQPESMEGGDLPVDAENTDAPETKPVEETAPDTAAQEKDAGEPAEKSDDQADTGDDKEQPVDSSLDELIAADEVADENEDAAGDPSELVTDANEELAVDEPVEKKEEDESAGGDDIDMDALDELLGSSDDK